MFVIDKPPYVREIVGSNTALIGTFPAKDTLVHDSSSWPAAWISSLPRATLSAIGLTEAFLLFIVAPLVHPRHSAVYHWTGSPQALFLPAILDVLIVWAVLTSLLVSVRRSANLRIALWSGMLLLGPLIVRRNWDLLWRESSGSLMVWIFYGLLFSCLAMLWWKLRSLAQALDRIVHVASTALMFAGVGAALLFCQLAWFGWRARALNEAQPLHHSAPRSASAPAGPRLIWIVFDELSYEQVYEHRFAGLQLPAFDALAQQSTVFSRAIPAGYYTDVVLPSLISGQALDLVRSSPEGYLSTQSAGRQPWQAFDPHQTIFQDALDAGYRTAVAGWYVPYCRILASVLDGCFWSYNIPGKGGMFPGGTIQTNMLRPLAYAWNTATLQRVAGEVLPASVVGVSDSKLHIKGYEALSRAAESILLDRSATFVLIHLPIPHLGGIYNRRTGQLTTGPSTYIDNLALADRSLARLRAVLEESGQWDASSVVVMGDHSWRVSLTRDDPSTWTTEEEKASRGGIFDDRPAYVIKLAGQHSARREDRPFRAIRTRALLAAMLARRIQSPQQLTAWIDTQR